MEKTIITKVVFYLGLVAIKIVANRSDNKIDDKVVEWLEGVFNEIK